MSARIGSARRASDAEETGRPPARWTLAVNTELDQILKSAESSLADVSRNSLLSAGASASVSVTVDPNTGDVKVKKKKKKQKRSHSVL